MDKNAEKAKREEIEQRTIEHLKARRLREASQSAGEAWADGRNADIDLKKLQAIFDARPGILSWATDEQLEALRVAAAMMDLFGSGRCKKWLPVGFDTGREITAEAAARMVLFYVNHRANLEQAKEIGIYRAVRIFGPDNACYECETLYAKEFAFDDVPELPHAACTHKDGCRCQYRPVR